MLSIGVWVPISGSEIYERRSQICWSTHSRLHVAEGVHFL